MRGDSLLDKMELIDPAYVEAAEEVPKRKRSGWLKWGSLAAGLCLVIAAAFLLARHSAPQQSDPSSLKTITIPEFSGRAMGFEGYMYYDISELNNGNPWSADMHLTSLPVYQNGAYDPSGAGIPTGLSEEEMTERLNLTAAALGLEVLSTGVITDGQEEKDTGTAPNADPTAIHAETNGGTIDVQADGGIIYFLPDEGFSLPDGYSFTYSNTTDAEAERVLSYLTETYRELLGFEAPKAISPGDYNIYGEFSRSYQVYDASEDDIENILNYNFCRVSFYPDENGNLSGIRINDGLLSAEKLGDYPIISVEEATERLIAGNYQTSVPAAFSGEEDIGKVELVYRTGRLEEVLLPYYRFYVLLPDTMNSSAAAQGLQTYGVYYVPAIAEEYIANMPTYDGSFN
ncbi:MAG: hypothetical protein ACI4V3_09720 [Faecousia sp.]